MTNAIRPAADHGQEERRLRAVMALLGVNAAEVADQMGYGRSEVSHQLSGRHASKGVYVAILQVALERAEAASA